MTRLRHALRTRGFDALVVVLALAGALEVTLGGDPELTASPWLLAPGTALVVLPLLARRPLPFLAPALVWLVAVALSFVDGRVIVTTTGIFVAGLTSAFLLGNLGHAVQARVGLAVVLGGAAVIAYNNPTHTAAALAFTPLMFSLAWLAGFAVQERAEQAAEAEERARAAERERDAATRIAVAEERSRIARELHDIVAHAVSVMVLQVGAVRHGLPDELTEDREALRGVERAGRTALAEMRRLLAAMHDGEDAELGPQPGLDRLGPLLEDVGRAGLPVELHVDGDSFPLPRAVDLSAYRIVQEGLTNVLKHARASRADVTLRYAPDALWVEVRDDGRGESDGDALGHGLVGIRERAKIYGGEMQAGAAPEGGFRVSVRLPVGGRS